MQKDFPDMVKLSSIGKSYKKKDISLMTVDARNFLMKQYPDENHILEGYFKNKKPAIMITGQHHAREHITSEFVLYSMLKMIHGGVVNDNKHYRNLLLQNKYYVVPTVNVDGVQFIED